METYRLKEEVESLELQNVENLTNNMKTACPTLDNADSSNYLESASDPLKDEKENHDISNENSFDRISRRPVETWKYEPLKAENNRTSYKCSLCYSVYQHKKSLNKHWKDKHSISNQTSSNSTASHDRILSTMNVNTQPIFRSTSVIVNSTGSDSRGFSMKNESNVPEVVINNEDVENVFSKFNRKRLSFQPDNEENNKENCPSMPSKRLSLIQPLSLNNASMILKPNNNNNVLKFVNVSNNNNLQSPANSESTENILDLRKPNNGALDLRMTSKSITMSKIFRCFQCTFRSGTVIELNDHFKMLHMSILLSMKSYQIPVNLYQKLLLNQFNTIVRTASEPLEIFNEKMNCCLCGLLFPTRYDMIQHIGAAHSMDMIWICLICGFGCCHPIPLRNHFQTHSDIQMLPCSQSSFIIPNNSITANDDSMTEKFIPPDFDNHLATSTPISAASKCKRIASKKDLVMLDLFNSKEKTLKCLVCDATARWRSELFTHMITHSEHRSFGCKFCSYRSKWKWDVPKHLKRCRLAPPHVRKPDVQNSYLITLLQHYSPPPGDILYQFMKEYNIKDIGSLNKSVCVKNEKDEGFHTPEQSSTNIENDQKLDTKSKEIDMYYQSAYEPISDASDGELDAEVDVGTDLISGTKDNSTNSESALKYTFKRCPWCQAFLTNKPSEMSCHLAQYHGDMDSGTS